MHVLCAVALLSSAKEFERNRSKELCFLPKIIIAFCLSQQHSPPIIFGSANAYCFYCHFLSFFYLFEFLERRTDRLTSCGIPALMSDSLQSVDMFIWLYCGITQNCRGRKGALQLL